MLTIRLDVVNYFGKLVTIFALLKVRPESAFRW